MKLMKLAGKIELTDVIEITVCAYVNGRDDSIMEEFLMV